MTVNILVPMAGLGSRFLKEGFTVPKQLINVGDKHLIDISLNCLNVRNTKYNLIFVIRDDQVYNFKLDEILKQKYEGAHVVVLDKLTGGSVESCWKAKEFIDNDDPLIIHTLDIEFSPPFDIGWMEKLDADGLILTFKSNSPNYSYAKIYNEHSPFVVSTAEKKAISPNACVGIYGFKRGRDFVTYAEQMIRENITTNGEFYIAPLYNLLIKDGLKILTEQVEKMHVFGTPEEFRFYKNNVCKKIGYNPIALCSDHSGYSTKELFKGVLKAKGLKFIDFGTIVNHDCNYSDYIKQAALAITNGECDFGFGFCRSGQGVNMCANKFKGIRSALIYNEFAMEMAIRHNCANFFAIPTSTTDLLDSFIKIAQNNSFDGGRHQLRVSELEEIGRTNDLFKY